MQSPFPHVLVIEDEQDLREATVCFLQLENMMAVGVGGLEAAEAALNSHDFDVLVLDLGLPDGDGLAWLAAHPDLGDTGVIITTARGEATSRITGVRAGADVYLVKPVQLEELVALIHNVMRRLRPATNRNWVLDVTTWCLNSPDGISVKLTHSERLLLLELAQVPGQSVSRDDLVCALGHRPEYYDPRRMEILIRRLRNKARDQLGYDLPLETAHRQGYAFTSGIEIKNGPSKPLMSANMGNDPQ